VVGLAVGVLEGLAVGAHVSPSEQHVKTQFGDNEQQN
jgi:hypothetical protein